MEKNQNQIVENNVINSTSKLKAFLFSFLVMLAGAVVWGLLYYIGLFTSWVSLITGLFAVIVYFKFNPNINWVVYVWTICVSITLNFLSLFATLAVYASSGLGVSFGEGLVYVFNLISEPEFMAALTSDIIYTVLFSIIGSVLTIIYFKKKIKNDQMIKEAKIQVQTQQDTQLDIQTQETNDISVSNLEVNNENKTQETTIVRSCDEMNEYSQKTVQLITDVVKVYAGNHDKEVFNKTVVEIKNNISKDLSNDEYHKLKLYAKEKMSESGLSNEEMIACQIITSQF